MFEKCLKYFTQHLEPLKITANLLHCPMGYGVVQSQRILSLVPNLAPLMQPPRHARRCWKDRPVGSLLQWVHLESSCAVCLFVFWDALMISLFSGPSVRWEGAGIPLCHLLPWPAGTQLTNTSWRGSCEHWAWPCCTAGRERTSGGYTPPILHLINNLSSPAVAVPWKEVFPAASPRSALPLCSWLHCTQSAQLLRLQLQFVKPAQISYNRKVAQFRMQTSSLCITAARGRCMAKVMPNLTSDLIIYWTITKLSKLQRLNSTHTQKE